MLGPVFSQNKRQHKHSFQKGSNALCVTAPSGFKLLNNIFDFEPQVLLEVHGSVGKRTQDPSLLKPYSSVSPASASASASAERKYDSNSALSSTEERTIEEQLQSVLEDLRNVLLFFGKYPLESLTWCCQHTAKKMVFRLRYGQGEQYMEKKVTQPGPLA